MKNSLRMALFALCINVPSVFAAPMLSADGSLLSSVDVDGTLYDVMFGDGVYGDVYAGLTFDAVREAEANTVSDAIAVALNELGATYLDIAGCDVNSRLRCLLFNPDSEYGPGGRSFLDSNMAATTVNLSWESPSRINVYAPLAADSSTSDHITLVTYERQPPSGIPAPATLLLFSLGLAGLEFCRRKKAKPTDNPINPAVVQHH